MTALPSDSTSDARIESLVSRWGAAIIVACALLLTSGLWWHTVHGHSYPLNLSWHEGFVREMRGGAVYPRWLTSTNQGLGAPSFYFYAPLPFFVSSLLDIAWPLRSSAAVFVNASATAAIVCSGLAMFSIVRRTCSPTGALLAAVVYMAMPYHLGIDLWWRSALGELWAFVWSPLIIAGAYRQWRGESWGAELLCAAWVGLILSHLPSFLITICGATCATTMWWWFSPDRTTVRRVIVHSVPAIALAVAVTAGYWFPALTTRGYADVTRFMTSSWFQYSNNFVLPYQPGSWNGTIEILLLLMLVALCVLSYLALRWQRHRAITFSMAVACVLAAAFMLTPASDVIWRAIPPLQRVQFPWRFLLLIDVGLVFLLAHVLDAPEAARARRRMVRALPLLSLIIGTAFPRVFTPDYATAVAADLEATLRTRADANEYRTRWTPVPFFYGVRNGDTVVARRTGAGARTPDAKGRVRFANGQPTSSAVVLNRFWYPSLRVLNEATGVALDARPESATGLAVITVPAGIQTVRVVTVLLPEERRAWTVSAVAVFFALGWIARRRLSVAA